MDTTRTSNSPERVTHNPFETVDSGSSYVAAGGGGDGYSESLQSFKRELSPFTRYM